MEKFTEFELSKIEDLVVDKIYKLESEVDYYNLYLSRHKEDLQQEYAKKILADCTRNLEYYISIKCKIENMHR